MSIWDDLMGRLKQTGDAVKTEATKRAAQATIDQLKARVSSAAGGLLDGMEEDLEKARAARAPAATPAPADAPAPTPSAAEQKAARRAKAAAELAAIKARLGKKDDTP